MADENDSNTPLPTGQKKELMFPRFARQSKQLIHEQLKPMSCNFSRIIEQYPGQLALVYIDYGFWVVPFKKGQRIQEAPPTRDVELFETGDFVAGLATGSTRRIVAIQSTGELGEKTLGAMEATHGPLTRLECRMMSQRILLFRCTEEPIPSRANFAPGLNFLGEDDYFVPDTGSWSGRHATLVNMPSWLIEYITGKFTFDIAQLVTRGFFHALNSATPFEAAQAYAARGWQLCNQHTRANADFWQDKPEEPIFVETSTASGVVALWIFDVQIQQYVERRHGKLPHPYFYYEGYYHFFRAPEQPYPSRHLCNGVEYVGERDNVLMPPYRPDNEKYIRWEKPKPISSDLQELPQWLHDLLSAPEATQSGTEPPTEAPEQAASITEPAIPLGTAAQHYAAQGWHVFPLKTGGKTPRTKNGLKNATTNQDQIVKWWNKWKNANIGVRTGTESGLVVLDVDTKKGQPGLQSLAKLEKEHGQLRTLRARTPSGGIHLFFRAPSQKVGNRAGFLPGLDFRGQNGYIVVAPSRIGNKGYSWKKAVEEIAALPDWLLHLVISKDKKGRSTRTEAPQESITYAQALAGVQEGSRNDTIFRFACRLRQDGFGHDEALPIVLTVARNCQPPLPDDEARRCLESAWRYDPPLALSDVGNAERFVARYGDQVRFVPESDQWLVWTRHWWQANLRALYRMAKATVRSLREEAATETDPARQKRLLAHGRRSENPEALERMLLLAGAELSVCATALDREGLVAFENGVFDRGINDIRPGRREDLLTKHAPFPYDPEDPQCHQWLERPGSVPAKATKNAEVAKELGERLDSWLAERCEQGPAFSERATVLRSDFSTWAGMEINPQRFGRLMTAKGFATRNSNGAVYDKLRLR